MKLISVVLKEALLDVTNSDEFWEEVDSAIKADLAKSEVDFYFVSEEPFISVRIGGDGSDNILEIPLEQCGMIEDDPEIAKSAIRVMIKKLEDFAQSLDKAV